MWDLGPGGIAPLGDILLQASVGVAVPCTIALVIQPCWLHRADEIFTWSVVVGISDNRAVHKKCQKQWFPTITKMSHC